MSSLADMDYEVVNPENMGSNNTQLYMYQNSDTNNEIIINITPPEDGPKMDLRIICLLDRSMSMITPITYKTENGMIEDDGLTRMDLAIHTYKTLVKTLPETSQLGLISFNKNAIKLMPLTTMDNDAKDKALEHTQMLNPTGMTNLWEPLQMALDMFLENSSSNYNDIIIMLTDGEPTQSPVKGEVNEMREYINAKFVGIDTKIPSFIPIGFTNAQDSVMLNGMASLTSEMQYYISDASMMGTVFINTLSYIYSIANSYSYLTIRAGADNVVFNENIVNIYPGVKYSEKELQIPVGSIGYGQNKNIVIPYLFVDNKETTSSFSVELFYITDKVNIIRTDVMTPVDAVYIENQYVRMNYVMIMNEVLKNMHDLGKCKSMLIEGLEQLRQFNKVGNKYLDNLDVDYLESIKAIQPEYIKLWGRHYLNSLRCAHMFERCSNFKDRGVQNYSSNVFQQYQKYGEELFKIIDIEKHTFVDDTPHLTSNIQRDWVGWGDYYGVVNTSGSTLRSSSSGRKQFKVKMAGVQRNYLAPKNGCFSGESMITMADGTYQRIDKIKKGDRVKSGQGNATVVTVVRFKCQDGKADMVTLSKDLVISPYHPIYNSYENRWVFPIDYSEHIVHKEHNMKYVYDFVLSCHHTIYVGDTLTCTFGHGIKGAVIGHEYFGTGKVIEDLQKIVGYERGRITVRDRFFLRATPDAPVTGMDYEYKYCNNK